MGYILPALRSVAHERGLPAGEAAGTKAIEALLLGISDLKESQKKTDSQILLNPFAFLARLVIYSICSLPKRAVGRH
jgi:hypothetical protein